MFIYFLNYIFKYVELIDTFLLALRGKPIQFLHIYHHAATLILCWSQLWAQSCIQWLPIVINLLVHVIMYAYYTLHALGYHIWWKKYLTVFQIMQFVVALTGCVLATAFLMLAEYGYLDKTVYGCNGTFLGAYIGIGVIGSYLYLFLLMYRDTYNSKKLAARAKASAAAKKNGAETNGKGAVKPISNGRSTAQFSFSDHQD